MRFPGPSRSPQLGSGSGHGGSPAPALWPSCGLGSQLSDGGQAGRRQELANSLGQELGPQPHEAHPVGGSGGVVLVFI